MRRLTVLVLFVLSFALAQSLTGTYSLTDPESGQTLTLSLEERPDNTFVGQMGLLGVNLELTGQMTGPGTGVAQFSPVEEQGTALGNVLITVQGDQLSMNFEDTGDVLTMTRDGAVPTPANTPTTDNGSGGDTIITDGEDTIITDEDDTIIDQGEVEYCKEFLADAEAVAEDPDEEAYCKDIIAASEMQVPTTPSNTPTTPTGTTTPTETTAPNPLNPGTANPGTAQNPLTATADKFSGIYRGENIAFTVQFANGQYTGTLEFNGQTYPVQAAAQGEQLAGTFQASGAAFDFVFYPKDTFFTLESGGNSYNLMKQP